MKADAMVWVQRIVGAVFAVGVLALIGAIVTQVGQAKGLPPLPIFVGILGIVVLVLLAGGCLALVSLAISARRGVDALRRIAGQGVANPVGQIWSAAMMLDHLGEPEASAAIMGAIEAVLADPRLRTRDLGGSADTETCGKAVADRLG